MRPLLALLIVATPAWAGDTWSDAEAVTRLSVRHDPPDCDTLGAHLADRAATLVRIVDEVDQPPWVGMRAARCAARLEAAAPQVEAWLADARWPGLTEAVLGELDQLTAPHAQRLAAAALAGPHRARAAHHARACRHPEVRALEAEVRALEARALQEAR